MKRAAGRSRSSRGAAKRTSPRTSCGACSVATSSAPSLPPQALLPSGTQTTCSTAAMFGWRGVVLSGTDFNWNSPAGEEQ